MANTIGVYACWENAFAIGNAGGVAAPTTPIADCTSFSIAFNNNVEEWTPFGEEGWMKRFMTGKDVTISVSAKRNVGDAGNDMVAGISFESGHSAEKDFVINFPDGSKAWFSNAVISVTNNSGGDSTNVAPLEFTVMSNGKPAFTPAA